MIVITTPTGQIGHHLTQRLLATNTPIRLILRDPAKLPEPLRHHAEIIQGAHNDPATLDRALPGASALFWLAPPTPAETLDDTYVGFTRPAADAIRRHQTPRIAVVTAIGRGTPWQNRAGLVTASLRMVDLLAETGAAIRGLAMPSFMENTLRQIDAIRNGQLFGPIDPDRKLPHTATPDMAEAAARLLQDLTWTGQEDLPVLGPEDLSFTDIAAILSDTLGREIRYRQIPFDAFKSQLTSRGMTDEYAQGYVDMMRAKNEGMDNAAPRTPESTTPTSFRHWAETVLEPALAA